ncbi:hypothetical protein [Streptomyces sp. NPDC060275]|uniref:hypothetical protein n=1 Tax=Streptomyces sp. NPDC060275 TaxID=3347090 RepID=UPI0036580522
MKRRTATAALRAAPLLTAVTTGAAVAAGPDGKPHDGPLPREAAALTGTAKPYRPAGDDVTLTFDARLAAEDKEDPWRRPGPSSAATA